MSPAPPFSVIALAPAVPLDQERQLATKLTQVFGRPAPPGKRFGEGFAVAETSSLEEASLVLQRVLQLGANGRIVDGRGAMLQEASSPTSSAAPEHDGELLSDDAAAELMDGLGLDAAAPASTVATDPLDNLVFLDGSCESKAPPPVALARTPTRSANPFAPPEDDTPLELDDHRLTPQGSLQPRGSSAGLPLSAQRSGGLRASSSDQSPPARDLPLAPRGTGPQLGSKGPAAGLPSGSAAGDVTRPGFKAPQGHLQPQLEAEEALELEAPVQQPTTPPVAASGPLPLDRPPAASPVLPQAPDSAKSASAPGAPMSRAAPATGLARARQQRPDLGAAGLTLLTARASGRLLWSGRLRERPRLRLLLGFLLALGLGSIVPACHARSVVSSRIEPQREDLSTAQAHGAILAQFPNYRSPEAIAETISSIRTRSSIITLILWLICAGGLGFIWFRYT